MSVINQMLRDLDARQASKQERAGLATQLRVLPAHRLSNIGIWPVLVAGAAAGAVVAGVAMWMLQTPPTPAVPAVPMPPPAQVTPPAPPPRSLDAIVEAQRLPIDLADMKLSLLLASAPPAAAPTATAAAPTKPALPKPAEPIEAARPPRDSATVASAPKQDTKASAPEPAAKPVLPPPDAQIDKRAKGGQAAEMADAEYRKGLQAVKRGDNASAVPLFQRALEFDPMLAKARQALMSVLVGERHWSEAQRVAQAGLAHDPAQSSWAMILARLQFEQGDSSGAIETLTRHAAYAAADAEYQGLFAYLLQKQQRPAEAVERFKAALALRHGEGRWWFGLGLALETANRSAEAREAYLKARETSNLPADMAAVIEQRLK